MWNVWVVQNSDLIMQHEACYLKLCHSMLVSTASMYIVMCENFSSFKCTVSWCIIKNCVDQWLPQKSEMLMLKNVTHSASKASYWNLCNITTFLRSKILMKWKSYRMLMICCKCCPPDRMHSVQLGKTLFTAWSLLFKSHGGCFLVLPGCEDLFFALCLLNFHTKVTRC